MIIIKLKGGLGNQMFQYAAGLAYASLKNENLKIDASGYDDPRYVYANTPRTYRLFPFSLSASLASLDEVKKYKYPFGIISKGMRFLNYKVLRRNLYFDYHPEFFKRTEKYIEGYFQSEKNFLNIKEKVLEEFTLKKEYQSELFLNEQNKITKDKSVAIHIRRGDYVYDKNTNNFHGTCSMDYYRKAMKLIEEKIRQAEFYFFSDDIAWVKSEFGEKDNHHFVSQSELKDYEELILMSLCSHQIIANSSFSWWGAYLNKNINKLIIAPSKWLNIEPDPQPNIIPETWIRL